MRSKCLACIFQLCSIWVIYLYDLFLVFEKKTVFFLTMFFIVEKKNCFFFKVCFFFQFFFFKFFLNAFNLLLTVV